MGDNGNSNVTAIPDSYSEGNVPIFKPNYEEFKDFYGYVKLINSYGMRSGIVKIVPPKEWVESLPPVDSEKIQSVRIRNPIIQHINGSKGVFVSENMERHRTYTLPEWKHLSEMQNYQPPVPRGQKRRPSSPAPGCIGNTSPELQNDSVDSSHDQAKTQRRRSLDKALLFSNFQHTIDASEFTQERCKFLEQNYWKMLAYAQPMYGADCLGSIFDDSVKYWNVAKLPNLLDFLDQHIPGVNDAYLYAGLWKASFAWHLEDQDLYSINYLHFGAPKQWYAIPQDQASRFYNLMTELFPENQKACKEFLRHKTFVCSPQLLASKNITVNKVIHYEHEFIITFPYGYHSGFNYDYNLAESVNFALDDWLDIGLKALKCECISDSVGIDVEGLIRNIKLHAEDDTKVSNNSIKKSIKEYVEASKNKELMNSHVKYENTFQHILTIPKQPKGRRPKKNSSTEAKITKPKTKSVNTGKPKHAPKKTLKQPDVVNENSQPATIKPISPKQELEKVKVPSSHPNQTVQNGRKNQRRTRSMAA